MLGSLYYSVISITQYEWWWCGGFMDELLANLFVRQVGDHGFIVAHFRNAAAPLLGQFTIVVLFEGFDELAYALV